jgi:hypothetical protein
VRVHAACPSSIVQGGAEWCSTTATAAAGRCEPPFLTRTAAPFGASSYFRRSQMSQLRLHSPRLTFPVFVFCHSTRCLGLIPFTCAALAFLCSMIFSFWCDSIQFPLAGGGGGGSTSAEFASDVRLGPWYWRQTDVVPVGAGGATLGDRTRVRNRCVALPGALEIDPAWKAVRAFSIMVPVIGGLLAAAIMFANCTYFLRDSTWKAIAVAFSVLLTLFQGLEFLLLQSNACSMNPLLYDSSLATENWTERVDAMYGTDCEWSAGSTANVFAVLFWFLAGATMLWLGPPQRPPVPPVETQTVTYERTVQPDGTTAIMETAVVKGVAVP